MGLTEVKNTLGVRKVSQGVLLYEELLKYLKKQETGGGLLKRALYRSAVKHRAAVRFR